MFDLENRLSLGFSFSDASQATRLVQPRECACLSAARYKYPKDVGVSLRAGRREHVLMELLERLEGERGVPV